MEEKQEDEENEQQLYAKFVEVITAIKSKGESVESQAEEF